jgi:hypothetical protein
MVDHHRNTHIALRLSHCRLTQMPAEGVQRSKGKTRSAVGAVAAILTLFLESDLALSLPACWLLLGEELGHFSGESLEELLVLMGVGMTALRSLALG